MDMNLPALLRNLSMKLTDSEILFFSFCAVMFIALILRLIYEQYIFSKNERKKEQQAKKEDRRRSDWTEYRESFGRAMRNQCDITSEDWSVK